MILIISEEGDVHAQAVMKQLASLGAEGRILYLGAFPKDGRATMEFSAERPWTGELRLPPSTVIPLAEVGAVWWRRPQAFELDPAIEDHGHQLFALGECEEMFGGLWPCLNALWINDPKRDEVAHRKPLQLRLAGEIGLPMPRSVMTNDPDVARRFVDELGIGNVVYKAFSATYEHWRETRLLKAEEAADLSSVRFCPVIFQEYIPCRCDLRVTIVDGEVFAAAILSQETDYKVDFRMNLSNVRIEAHDMPAGVRSGLLQLMDRLGLVYGAADFRLTPDGQYVFLEINPAGQWLFVEDATHQPIARRLAETLARADQAHGRAR